MIRKIRKGVIAVLVILIIIVAGGFLGRTLIESKEEKVVSILTVNDTEFFLQDLMYYIWDMEMKVNEMALSYDYADPSKFWNTYTNGRFTRLRAKDLVIENAIRDEVLYQEALKHNFSLEESEKERVLERAEELNFELSEYQRDITRLTLEDFQKIVEKQALGEKYADFLVEVNGLIEKDILVEGEYFEKLKEEYQVEVQEEEWKLVEMGQVTL